MDRGVSTIEACVADAEGLRLDRALADALPTISRERLKALISTGAVTDAQGVLRRDPASKAVPGGLYRVTVPDPQPAHNEPQDIALNVVFEDDHLIVIDKQAGLVVHPAAGNFDGTLVNALLHHCAGRLSGIGGVARPGIVHRIDKDTSGLMVAAKTDRAHVGLAKQFAAHSIDRRVDVDHLARHPVLLSQATGCCGACPRLTVSTAPGHRPGAAARRSRAHRTDGGRTRSGAGPPHARGDSRPGRGRRWRSDGDRHAAHR
jgi:hypothetical protein